MAESAPIITQLHRLATACADAAEAGGSARALEHRYATLRAEALAFNAQHGWATPEEFEAQFLTLDSLSVIEALDRAPQPGPEPADRIVQRNDRLRQLLRDVAGWTTGVRTAYETLEDINGD
jgi:hypothetical protein